MTCREPACPFPADRAGYCARHFRLHHGSEVDLRFDKRGKPEPGIENWTAGMARPIRGLQPDNGLRRPPPARPVASASAAAPSAAQQSRGGRQRAFSKQQVARRVIEAGRPTTRRESEQVSEAF